MPNDKSGKRDEEEHFDEDSIEEDEDLEEDLEEIDEEDDEEENALAFEDIRVFEKTEAQLEGFYEEIGNIAKKKPDDAVNTFKLGFINQMLESANRLLGEDYLPFPDFEKFDPDVLPTASDVVTMLSQYLRSMDKFRKDTTYIELHKYYWYCSDSAKQTRAKPPKSFEK